MEKNLIEDLCVVPFSVACNLSVLGWNKPTFWMYQEGELTHTGIDGFDEGEFNFIRDYFLDCNDPENKFLLAAHKTCVFANPSEKLPEFVSAPHIDEVIEWLAESKGINISAYSVGTEEKTSWVSRWDTKDRRRCCTNSTGSWKQAVLLALEEATEFLIDPSSH